MFNSDFLEKGIVFLTHFVYSFSRKMFLILLSMCIETVCDVIKLEISLIFLIQAFLNRTENLRQKF